jgi:hypothetical protein
MSVGAIAVASHDSAGIIGDLVSILIRFAHLRQRFQLPTAAAVGRSLLALGVAMLLGRQAGVIVNTFICEQAASV